VSALIRYILVPAVVGATLGLVVTFLLFELKADDRPGYASAVRRAAPAVVNIYSSRTLEPSICQQPSFQEWCERFRGDTPGNLQTSLGSGVIATAEGHILTNNHVIEGADEIFVMFADGQSTLASLVGADPETDLAVIRVEAQGLTPIRVGDSDRAEVGDVVLAIGNPFGIGQTVSAGIISAKGRTGVSESLYDDFIQTDAAINPGNSGGALIDTDGRLIGINTLIYDGAGQAQGIGFALPARLAFSILDEIVETGKVTRGWLGVMLSPPGPDESGLLVTRVTPSSPAAEAGVLPGDRLLAVNHTAATDLAHLSRLIAEIPPGAEILITLRRRGDDLEVSTTAAARPTR